MYMVTCDVVSSAVWRAGDGNLLVRGPGTLAPLAHQGPLLSAALALTQLTQGYTSTWTQDSD